MIVDEQTLVLLTDLEVRKAVRLQYYVSLLAVQAEFEGFTPLPETQEVPWQIADVMSREIRNTDAIRIRQAWPHLHVLLVSAPLYNLPIIIERLVRAVNRHPFAISDTSQPVSLAIGGACFPTTARGLEDLSTQVATLVAEAQHDRTRGHRYRLASRFL